MSVELSGICILKSNFYPGMVKFITSWIKNEAQDMLSYSLYFFTVRATI